MNYDDGNDCHVEPCRFCGDLVRLFDGARVYDPEGFPYAHECPPYALRIPNQGDFPGAPQWKPRGREKPLRVLRVKQQGGVDL